MKENNAKSIGFGIALGAVIGVATGNIGLWLPLGVALGVGIATVSGDRKKK